MANPGKLDKKTLFKFSTIRGINIADPSILRKNNISHPDFSKSRYSNVERPSPKQELSNCTKDLPEGLVELANAINYGTIEDSQLADKAGTLKPISKKQELEVWDNLFEEIIFNRRARNRRQFAGILRANNLIKKIQNTTNENQTKRKSATASAVDLGTIRTAVAIPAAVLDIARDFEVGDCSEGMFGVKNLGVMDFRKIEQSLCCYVPGLVSHIENVMAREFKEKHTRNLVSTEITTETSRSSEIENLSDTATTTRNEMSSEVASVLEKQKSFTAGGTVSYQSGEGTPYSVSASANLGFSSSVSSSVSNQLAKNYAQEVTEKALQRVIQKTKEKRTAKYIKEFEVNNRHGFDNRSGENHVTGTYRWLDLIMENTMVNYGRRLVMQVHVPEPARFYYEAIHYVTPIESDGAAESGSPPKTLEDFGVNSMDDLNPDSAKEAAVYYGVAVEELPESVKNIKKGYTPQVEHERKESSQTLQGFSCPANYELVNVSGSYKFQYRANSWSSSVPGYCDFNIGGKHVGSGSDYDANKTNKTVGVNLNFSPSIEGSVPVNVTFASTFSITANLNFKCVLSSSYKKEWQQSLYEDMVSAYEAKVAKYEEDKQSAEEVDEGSEDNRDQIINPAKLRVIEQQELKRLVIEMLLRPFCKNIGQEFYGYRKKCEYPIPTILQNEEFEKYVELIEFLNNAIDWDLMYYEFMSYMMANECRWIELIQRSHIDLTHEAFLKSGMAKIIFPVKCAFAKAMVYFLETGQINLDDDFVPEDNEDFYLSLMEELKDCDEEIEVEGNWFTRVPSNLNIIQQDSALVGEEGLPCCDHISEEEIQNTLKPHYAKLEKLPDGP